MRIKYNIIFIILILLLPIYFKNNFNFTFGYLLLPFIILNVLLFKDVKLESSLIWIILYTVFAFIQLIFIEKIDFKIFGIKYLTIISFIIYFHVARNLYSIKYDKFIIISLVVCSIYGVYAAFSYMFSYDNYLIPGTCAISNINEFGILRCSTFGEGNYFGNYLALLSILYADKRKILYLTFAMSLIAFSPIPIIIILYLLIKKYINTLIYLIIILSLTYIIYVFNTDKILGSLYSETSSFGERTEFIISAIRMGFDQIFLGVGLGQYGNNLPFYTNYQHLIQLQFESVRFIPNNNIAELFSEQGIFGLLFFGYYLKYFSNGHISKIPAIYILIMIVLLGSAMPTLYLIYVSVLTGCISRKMKLKN
jgi:hypothetical protein